MRISDKVAEPKVRRSLALSVLYSVSVALAYTSGISRHRCPSYLGLPLFDGVQGQSKLQCKCLVEHKSTLSIRVLSLSLLLITSVFWYSGLRSPLERPRRSMTSQNADREQSGALASNEGGAAVPLAQTPVLPGVIGGQMHFGSGLHKSCGNMSTLILGAGVLGMPYTLEESGWLRGPMALAFVGLACFHYMMLLVNSKPEVKVGKDGKDGVHSYSDLGLVTFGKRGKLFTDLVIVLAQGGFCVAYLSVIGENFESYNAAGVTDGSNPALNSVVSGQGVLPFNSKGPVLNWQAKALYITIVLPFQIWLASIRSVTRLPAINMYADVLNASAMAVVMSASKDLQLEPHGMRIVDVFTEYFFYFHILVVMVLYAVERIGLVFPLENCVEDQSKFLDTLASAMVFITGQFIIFASLGYFGFGEGTKDLIPLSLGNTWQTYFIKLAIHCGVFFTFPAMMHPVHEVVERRFWNGRPSFFLRTLTVSVMVWMAVSFPQYRNFLSVIGSSVCCLMSFLFPSVFHLWIHTGDLWWWQIVADSSYIAFGLCVGCWGICAAVQSWP